LRPAPEDFAMVRLILLALLPQIGGILMMVGRSARVINADKPVMAANSEASTAC
jgi:hypothetical protein